MKFGLSALGELKQVLNGLQRLFIQASQTQAFYENNHQRHVAVYLLFADAHRVQPGGIMGQGSGVLRSRKHVTNQCSDDQTGLTLPNQHGRPATAWSNPA